MRKWACFACTLLLVAACQDRNATQQPVDTTLNDEEPAALVSDDAPAPSDGETSATGRDLEAQGTEAGGPYASTASDYGYDPRTAPISEPEPVGPRDAEARGDISAWITADDYPPSSVRAEEEGDVVIQWDVGITGRVENCRVTSSSGSEALDQAACRAITRRGRYTPATDETGTPITKTMSRRVNWRLPR
ncbi:energy transducer TonB [Sphingomonas sp. ABOLG]|uniref:energy transducer TonB n=1 Tax=Sphingomonas sp. ABOLG TaxID=1985880 RepID=UPI000F7E3A02|nr:energy transducer TonB [Sphingomonas sp. ABOLG]RSV20362.1 energy transducer TonB [Sphingomonas sp. ABOLG]